MNKSKNIHFHSVTQKSLEMSDMRKYFILNPISDEVTDIMRRYNNIYKKNSTIWGSLFIETINHKSC